jgi:hypothetical protein
MLAITNRIEKKTTKILALLVLILSEVISEKCITLNPQAIILIKKKKNFKEFWAEF